MAEIHTPGFAPKTEYVEGIMTDRLQEVWAKTSLLGMVNPYYFNEVDDMDRVSNLRDAISGAMVLYALRDVDAMNKFTLSDATTALQEKSSVARMDRRLTYSNKKSVAPSDIEVSLRDGIDLLVESKLVDTIGIVRENKAAAPVYRTTKDARRLLATYPEIPFTVVPTNLVSKGCGMLILSELALGGTAAVEYAMDAYAISNDSLLKTGFAMLVLSIPGLFVPPYIDAKRAYQRYYDHNGRPPSGPNLRLVR